MRIVSSRSFSVGTAVIVTCLPMCGIAILGFEICMTWPLSPTSTTDPLVSVHCGSQVAMWDGCTTHAELQIVPLIFVLWAWAHGNAAKHKTPRNNQIACFIRASYTRELTTCSGSSVGPNSDVVPFGMRDAKQRCCQNKAAQLPHHARSRIA